MKWTTDIQAAWDAYCKARDAYHGETYGKKFDDYDKAWWEFRRVFELHNPLPHDPELVTYELKSTKCPPHSAKRLS